MSQKVFSIRFEVEESFSVKEIWPDGDAPENPTAEDVKKEFLRSCRRDIIQGLEDWGMIDRYDQWSLDIIELRLPKPFPSPWLYMPTDREEARWENEGGR